MDTHNTCPKLPSTSPEASTLCFSRYSPGPKLFSIWHLNENDTTEDEIVEAVTNLDTVNLCYVTQTQNVFDIEKNYFLSS